MDLSNQVIGFIGAGNMGQSMIQGLIQHPPQPKRILISDHHPEKLAPITKQSNIELITNKAQLMKEVNILILAVKPQSMIQALKEIEGFDQAKRPIIISVAAGVKIQQIRDGLNLQQDYPIIRLMPNTPALMQAGMSGLYGQSLSEAIRQSSEMVASAIGQWVWVEDESLMDVVTALSGSGPAYFFYFTEQLIEGAMQLGLSKEVAKKLALYTGLGALKMVEKSDSSLAQLRQNVTSKGGTTEAGLTALAEHDFAAIIHKALSKAAQRGREISKQLEESMSASK